MDSYNIATEPKGNRTQMVFKTKRDAKGNIIKYKARLVAKGYVQEQGIDFDEKQPTVALSSCESEFMAATGAACQALWLKRLLSELTGWEEKRITLKVDNISAIALVRNPVFHGRSKHIDIRYHFIRECVENGPTSNVEHVSGELHKIRKLTKAYQYMKFVTIRQMLRRVGTYNLANAKEEVLWFKEIEKMMPPYLTDMKNKNGLTAYELFSKENEDQVSSGLKWMNECMIVDTLLVAVAFAVAFTVPGGYRQDNGFPFFLHQISYLVFVIADGVSLLLSAISLLVFLSVLTSRFGPRDFMYSLPSKLMIGLLGLVISVGAMTVTFTASFFMLYHNGLIWLPILCAIFAPLPAIVFVVLQYPILIDMYRSTYDSRYLFNPEKRLLYNIKPKFRSSNYAGMV
ncbi:ankyrin repeat-containing protein [Tanacetum coccineum]